MSFASRHNKVNRWDVNTDGFEYKKIADIVAADGEDVAYTVRGVRISRGGKYGDSAVVILDTCFVNLPKHMVEDMDQILASGEDVEDIKAGKVGIEFYSYEGRDGKPHYSANWVDM